MNVPQQLFAIFFAIFWGTSSNAWPKWKPFHWTLLLHSGRIFCRTVLSLVILNVFPVLFFVWMLGKLGGLIPDDALSSFGSTWRVVVPAIVPAFAVFGFYRLWVGLIEIKPELFYHAKDKINGDFAPRNVTGPNGEDFIEPTIESLGLEGKDWSAGPNLLFAATYIVVSAVVPLFWPPV